MLRHSNRSCSTFLLETKRADVRRIQADVIARLKAFPNPHAIWAAFRARIIDEETAFSLLPNTQRETLMEADIVREISNVLQRIWYTFASAPTARYKRG